MENWMGIRFFFLFFASRIIEKQAQRAAGNKYCVKIR